MKGSNKKGCSLLNGEIYSLYPIPPIGVGTPYMESLSSYIKRLAKIHSVSPVTLVSKELLPNRAYLKPINNPASYLSNEIVSALVKKTGVPQIRKLFLRYGDHLLEKKHIFREDHFVDTRHIFRESLAWCPICFEESKISHLEIYEKMLWCFSDVSSCSIHGISLIDQCPYCKNRVKILSASSIVGYCDKCLSWIGLSDQMMLHLEYVNKSWSIKIKRIEQIIENNGYHTEKWVFKEYLSLHRIY